MIDDDDHDRGHEPSAGGKTSLPPQNALPDDDVVLNWEPRPGDMAEIEAMCRRLKAALP